MNKLTRRRKIQSNELESNINNKKNYEDDLTKNSKLTINKNKIQESVLNFINTEDIKDIEDILVDLHDYVATVFKLLDESL